MYQTSKSVKKMLGVKKLCYRAYLGRRNSSRRYASSGSASQQSAAQSAAATGSSETITTQVKKAAALISIFITICIPSTPYITPETYSLAI